MLNLYFTSLHCYFKYPKTMIWTDETNINLETKHATSSVKHGGRSIMAWTYLAATGTGPVVFYDAVTAKAAGWAVTCTGLHSQSQIQLNAAQLIRQRFGVKMDNDPKDSAGTRISQGKKWYILQWSQPNRAYFSHT